MITTDSGSRVTAAGRSSLAILALAVLLGGCDDPTVADPHLAVEGVAILDGTTEIYRYHVDDGVPPTLSLDPGPRDVIFLLLDHAGDPMAEADHDDDDEEHVLEITIADPDILAWVPETETDAHDRVEFHGVLVALQPGSTIMTVCVPHGGHCDFDADIPVSVPPS